jgi:hypothetical protein
MVLPTGTSVPVSLARFATIVRLVPRMDADPELEHMMDGEPKLVQTGDRSSAHRLDRLLFRVPR